MRWAHVAWTVPPRPGRAARGVWRSVRGARRDQDRTVPPHPACPNWRPMRPRASGRPGRRATAGRPAVAGHRAGVHHPPGHRAGRGQRPEDVQTGLHHGRGRDGWAPRELRTSFVSVLSHRGSASRRSPGWPGTAPPGPPRSSITENCDRSSPPAPRSWTRSSQEATSQRRQARLLRQARN